MLLVDQTACATYETEEHST